MDALAAIGLVGNIVAFIDFGVKVVGAVKEIQSSTSGSTKKNEELDSLGERIKEQATNIAQKKSMAPVDAFEIGLMERATECIQLSTELQDLVQKMKSANPGSKRESIKAIYRTYRKKDMRDILEQKLRDCKDQLQLQLITVEGSRMMRCLDEIIASGTSRDRNIHQIVTDIDLLTAGVKAMEFTPGAMEQVMSLLKRSEQAIDTTLQHEILKELAIDRLTDRFDNVEQAHMDTFSWLLDIEDEEEDPVDEYSSQHSERVSDPRSSEAYNSYDHNYTSNLSTEFDDNDDESLDDTQIQAKKDLTDWLLTGQGIFHVSGQPGAGKSTLMKFLCQSPTTKKYLTSWASGKHLVVGNFFFWKLGTEIQKSVRGLRRGLLHSVVSQDLGLLKPLFQKQWHSIRQHSAVHLDNEDIENAFEILVNAKATLASHRFAIFIDGLDELQGDHGKMVGQLFKWTSSNPTDIKICVSSREWFVFMELFSKCPKIQLHQITYQDIKKFVHDELAEAEEFTTSLHRQELMGLADQIVGSAQGVFLWAKIALQNFRNGFLVGYGIEHLKKMICELPRELNDLYLAIFESIMNLSLPSDRIKAMKTIAIVLEVRSLSVVQLSFLDEYEDNKDFAYNLPVRRGRHEEFAKRSKLAQNQIRYWCMGLLECNARDHQRSLGFSHLSVEEFFNQSQIRRTITSFIGNFEPLDFMMQSSIAMFKIFEDLQEDRDNRSIKLRILLFSHWQARLWPSYGDRMSKSFDTIIDTLEQLGKPLRGRQKGYCKKPGCREDSKLFTPKEFVHHVAVDYGVYRYFLRDCETMAPRYDEYKEGKLLRAVLRSVSHGYPVPTTVDGKESWSAVTLLALAYCLEHYTPPNSASNCQHESVWQSFIIDSILESGKDQRLLEPTIRLLLLHGADPDIWLELKDHKRKGTSHTSRDYMILSVRAGKGEQTIGVGPKVYAPSDDDSTVQIVEWSKSSGRAMHLRDLVRIWCPDNAEILQHLIDRNLGKPGPLTGRTLSDLKADPELDLDVTKGLTYKPARRLLSIY